MKFDIFCEIQRAKPWGKDHEAVLFRDTIEEAKAADEAGFDTWWQVEHHSAAEFSYSAAPDLVLAAIALNTKRIHVGHAGVLAPFRINNPYRVAERAATLDILSGGRLELGFAKSGGKEWETFGVVPETARDQVREAFNIVRRFWSEGEIAFKTPDFEIPARECVPKPVQSPQPRFWQTCGSPESFRMAGELGVGSLGTTLLSPVSFMGQMLDEYRKGLKACKQPVGKMLNDQKGIFTFVHVADSRKLAIKNRAAWSALWYVNAAPIVFKVPRAVWYDVIRSGLHPNAPRDTAVTGSDQTSLDIAPDELPVLRLLKLMAKGEEVSAEEAHEVLEELDSVVVGDPDHCRKKLDAYANIGTDRMMCLMQFGQIPHEATMRSIKLTGEQLIPYFAKRTRAAAE